MLNTLNPRKQYRAIGRALRARGAKIYNCEDCDYIWIADAEEPPIRCANRSCRAPANGRKRNPVEAQ